MFLPISYVQQILVEMLLVIQKISSLGAETYVRCIFNSRKAEEMKRRMMSQTSNELDSPTRSKSTPSTPQMGRHTPPATPRGGPGLLGGPQTPPAAATNSSYLQVNHPASSVSQPTTPTRKTANFKVSFDIIGMKYDTRNLCVALVCPAKCRSHGTPVN